MSYTNTTENLSLPAWTGNDKPNWVPDMVEAFDHIDSFAGDINHRLDDNDTTNVDYDQRITTNKNSIDNINKYQETQDGRITDCEENIEAIQEVNAKQSSDLTELSSKVKLNTDNLTALQNQCDETDSNLSLLQGNFNEAKPTIDDLDVPLNRRNVLLTVSTKASNVYFIDFDRAFISDGQAKIIMVKAQDMTSRYYARVSRSSNALLWTAYDPNDGKNHTNDINTIRNIGFILLSTVDGSGVSSAPFIRLIYNKNTNGLEEVTNLIDIINILSTWRLYILNE